MLISIHNAINGDDESPVLIIRVLEVIISNKKTIKAIKKIFFLGVHIYVIMQISAIAIARINAGRVIINGLPTPKMLP